MTCRYLYRCLQPTSRVFLSSTFPKWQSALTIPSLEPSRSYAFNTSRKNRNKTTGNATDPKLAQYWATIHDAEAYLKLPLSKVDGRWRAKRLRGRARALLQQKIDKKIEKSGDDPKERSRLVKKMSAFELELYHEDEGTVASASTIPDLIGKALDESLKMEAKAHVRPSPGSSEPNKTKDVGNTRHERPARPNKNKEPWQVQKEALKDKFGDEPWTPRKKLSPGTMDGMRMLHQSDKAKYTTAVLADSFKISPDAVRRILKSKWEPSEEEADERRERWERRGQKIWENKVEMGMKPPKKWRERGVGRAEPGFYPKWKKGGQAKPFASDDPLPFGESYTEVRARKEPRDIRTVSSQIL
ncbi:hypothetical protein EJ05DRAFT_197610 [Pseudovirgaria hyperparasitica]|uniref:Required for respiratory growth protein 9, mitochondrial n=1 Tax=Pseudovirgaria hyperparasitica TaxID=470096 RepID=A0A6A6WK22_9PEZI|nr:uncharacterized protein EJ05DRAFT_197610 [Pseudovirgaria hyperparasitica]KAF2762111.1 hypothetical protein EJ05DRAFT_197610 [Pseudovirgaria hyperparasitica]